jgi:carbonic anhydrase
MWQSRSTSRAMSTNGEKNIQQGNKEYAATFTQGDLALPPSQKYVVCMCQNR